LIKNPWLQILYGVLLALLLDGLLFHSGIYARYLDPRSTAGELHGLLTVAKPKEMRGAVAVVGDSRIAEGFSAKLADAMGGGVRFVNLGIPGTTPRVWHYFLRELDPDARRFSAVVIMLPNYDETSKENFNDRTLDLSYLAPILRYGDAAPVAGSFDSRDARSRALLFTFLRGVAYKQDILDFILHPAERLKNVNGYIEKRWRAIYDYPGRPDSLEGVSVDSAGRLRFPASIKPELKPLLQTYLAEMHYDERLQHHERYRALWLGRIAERYRNSRLFIFQIPRGPLHYLKPAVAPFGVLAKLEANVLPADAFTAFERPGFFFDQLHLNARGREGFSKALVARILPLLK